MKIKGLNVDTTLGDPSIEEWKKTFKSNFSSSLSPEQLESFANAIVNAYQQACDFDGAVTAIDVDENGELYFPDGALLHLIPCDTVENLREKLASIKKHGLLSLGMFEDGDEWDLEVPLSASFHRILPKQSVPDKIEGLKASAKLPTIGNIGIIFDTRSSGMQKLLAYDISKRNEQMDLTQKYVGERTQKFVAYKYKSYPEQIKSETEKQALCMYAFAERPISSGKNFAYLPLGVPGKYIVGFVLPDKLKDNQQVIDMLRKLFPAATICTMDGKVIGQSGAEEQRSM